MRRGLVVFASALFAVACASATPFERYLSEQRWSEAAAAFAADSTLLNNENALYKVGMLYGTPGRPTYDPARAHDYLSALLTRFPSTGHRNDATERLALVDEVLHTRGDATARQQELDAKIATLNAQIRDLSARLDSALAQRDSARTAVTRLDTDRKDREEQLHALRLELQRLKEIDLKTRTPPGAIKP